MQDFLQTVCAQVRWRRAHETISRDLSDHIEDQAEAYEREGASRGEAKRRAVTQMGDPVELGMLMDASYRPATPWRMLLYVALSAALGILLQFVVYGDYGSYHPYAGMGGSIDNWGLTAVGWVLGAGLFFALYYTGSVRIARLAWPFYGCTLAFVLVQRSFLLHAKIWNWLWSIGFRFTSYLSQYQLLLIPVAVALLLIRCKRYGNKGICIATLAYMALLFAAECSLYREIFDFTYTLFAAMLLYAFAERWYTGKYRALLLLATLLLPIALFALMRLPYGRFSSELLGVYGNRFAMNLATLRALLAPGGNHSADVWKEGWQLPPELVRDCLKNAGWFGAGTTVPHAEIQLMEGPFNPIDYMLSRIVYRYGWAAGIATVAAPTALLAAGYYKNARQSSESARMLGFSILTLMTLQGLLYCMRNLGLSTMLQHSLPLPLLSYGNISRVLHLALLGLLLSLFRTDGLYTERLAKRKRGRSRARKDARDCLPCDAKEPDASR